MTDDKTNNLYPALAAVQDSREYIIKELRAMAAAENDYRRFTYISKWIKNIWHAAADMLEHDAVMAQQKSNYDA